MTGVVRVSKKRSDLWGRLPLFKSKAGETAYRDTGTETLSKNEKALSDVILRANDLIPRDAAQRLIDGGDIATYNRTVLNALAPLQDVIETLLLKELVESAVITTRETVQSISNQYAAIGKAESLTPPLPSKIVMQHTFDQTAPGAISFAKKQSAQLVTNMVESQREAIRQVVARAYKVGRTPAQLQSDLVAALKLVNPTTDPAKSLATLFGTNVNGLTTRYEQAVATRAEKIAKDLAKKGITGSKAVEKVKKDTQKYADKLRKARARTIARTEMMTANNEGKLQSFLQMEKKGIISPKNSRKQWSTGRFDVCNICAPLNGQLQPLNKPFSTGRMTPPAHPNCRCTMMLVTDVKTHTPPQPIGGNTPENPLGFTPGKLTEAGQTAADTPIVIDVVPQTSEVIPVSLEPSMSASEAQALADEALGVGGEASTTIATTEALPITYPKSNGVWSYTHYPDGTSSVLNPSDSSLEYLLNDDGTVTFISQSGIPSTIKPTPNSALGETIDAMTPNPYKQTSIQMDFPETDTTYAFTHQPDGKTIIHGGGGDYILDTDGQLFMYDKWGTKELLFPAKGSGISDTVDVILTKHPNPTLTVEPPAFVDVTPVKPKVNTPPEGVIKVPTNGKIMEHEYWPNGDVHLHDPFQPGTSYLITPEGKVYRYDGFMSEQIVPTKGSGLGVLIEHLKETDNPFIVKPVIDINVVSKIPKADQQVVSIIDAYGEQKQMYQLSEGIWEYETKTGFKYRYSERTGTWFEQESINNFVDMEGGYPGGTKELIDKLKSLKTSGQLLKPTITPVAPVQLTNTNVVKLPFEGIDVEFIEVSPNSGVYQVNSIKNNRIYQSRRWDKNTQEWSYFDKETGTWLKGVDALDEDYWDELAVEFEMNGFSNTTVQLKPSVIELPQVKTPVAPVTPTPAAAPTTPTVKPTGPIKVKATKDLPEHIVDGDVIRYTNNNGKKFIIKKDGTIFREADDGSIGAKFLPNKGTPLRKLGDHYSNNPQLFDDPLATVNVTAPTAPKPQKGPPKVTVKLPDGPVTPIPSPATQTTTGPWDVPDIKGGLKLDAQASTKLAGQNPKRVYTDSTGQQYIFKPQERWQAELEVATNNAMEMLGVPHAEVELVTINGQTGSLHKVLSEGGRVDSVKPAFGNSGVFDPTKLSEQQVEALQQNQLADWIIGNYDSHTEQFIRLSSSSDSAITPIGIDKGQAFKHLGKNAGDDADALWKFLENGSHYNPNKNASTKMAYQKLWDDFTAGKGVNIVKPSESGKIQLLLKRVEGITQRGSGEHKAFVDLWKNYADEAFKAGKLPKGMTPEKFVETLMKRLDDLAAKVAKQEELLVGTDAWKLKNGISIKIQTPETASIDPTLLAREYKFRSEQYFDNQYGSKVSGLPADQQVALKSYSGSGYVEINRSLRDNVLESDSVSRKIKKIDAAMSNSVLTEDVKVVRRAQSWTDANGSEVKLKNAVGKVIIHDNFVSTTAKSSGVFAGETLELSVPAGTRAVWLKPISHHAREEELLIDRGYRILITGQRVENNVTIYEGVVIPDDVASTAIPKYVKKPVPT